MADTKLGVYNSVGVLFTGAFSRHQNQRILERPVIDLQQIFTVEVIRSVKEEMVTEIALPYREKCPLSSTFVTVTGGESLSGTPSTSL